MTWPAVVQHGISQDERFLLHAGKAGQISQAALVLGQFREDLGPALCPAVRRQAQATIPIGPGGLGRELAHGSKIARLAYPLHHAGHRQLVKRRRLARNLRKFQILVDAGAETRDDQVKRRGRWLVWATVMISTASGRSR